MDPFNLRQTWTNKYVQMMEAQRNRPATVLSKTVRHKIIEKYLNLDSGLLDKLLGCGLLTWDEFDDVKTTGTQRNKNEKLMNLILRKNLYKSFVSLLSETQQSHLVDYENDSDYYRRLFNGDIPLTVREESILDLNREVIVELFKHSPDLVEQLYQRGVLTETQKEIMCSASIRQGEALVDMMRRGSLKVFKMTIHCLRGMRVYQLANVLEGGVTCQVSCSIEDYSKEHVVQDSIVREFLTKLNERESQRVGSNCNLRLLRLGLSYVRRNNGIVLYFHLRSFDDLRALKTEFVNGSLGQKSEDDFNDLVTLKPTAERLKLTLDWADHDYKRCALYFTLVSSTTVNDLPLEILDIILQRTVRFLQIHVHVHVPGNAASASTAVSRLVSLASVNCCWSQRLNKSVFKKNVQRIDSAEVQKDKKRLAILRNNSKYLLVENRPNELIPQLIKSGCLDERQASSLRRLRNDKEKNSKLLSIARGFSSQRHFQFVESLYLTNQLNVARIVERGGATVKMSIENEAIPDASAVEKILVGKLQKILRENNDAKLWPHNLFNSLSIYDIVILNAQQGKKVIDLWLWCQSQETLERLRNVQESELIKITDQIFRQFQSSTLIKPQNVSIDPSCFKCDVVVRRLSVKFRGSLLCPLGQDPDRIYAVTSLEDKIYATSDRKIHVYDNKSPYSELEHIDLPLTKSFNSLNLTACRVNRCLYIVDKNADSIWKMTPADNKELTKWRNELLPNLSVTRDGKVLLISDNNEMNPKLRIHNTDAELECSVPLRGDATYIYSWAAVEFAPGVVAVQYEKSGPRGVSKGIAIMRLNETGDVLRDVETERLFGLASYSIGRLIATDHLSNEVILLDDQLKPLEVVLSVDERGLEWPRCFCYRKDTGELIVSHFGGSVVIDHYQFDVYKLGFNDESDA